MTTGAILTLLLALPFIGWLIVDWLIWREDGETCTRWTIAHTRKRAWAWALFLAIVGTAVFLVWHFELPPVL